MKKAILLLLTITVFSTFASESDYVLNCEQHDDADQWLEVNITLNDGPGYRLSVIKHDYDDASKKVLLDEIVFKTKCGYMDCYRDSFDTVKLTSKDSEFKKARFSAIRNGYNSIIDNNMSCE